MPGALQGGSVPEGMPFPMTDEVNYKILKLLEENPNLSQRELAKSMGISLGKANYCLQALIQKGLVKARNFSNSKSKRAYFYILTPKGIEEKATITVRFLKHKLREYEALKNEIEALQKETEGLANQSEPHKEQKG